MDVDSSSSADKMSNIKLKEQFVQNHNGSTMVDVMSFLSQVPLFVFITLFIELCILSKWNLNIYQSGPAKIKNATLVFVLEFASIVVPLVFMFTMLSDSTLFIFLCVTAAIFAIVINSASSPDESVHYWKIPHFTGPLFSELVTIGKQPFVTYFRALTFLVTSISILGVDFHAYPRRFAKTETFGVSLMDIGVGLFVFSNAIVVKTSNVLSKEIKQTCLESLVFIVLGVTRYLLLQYLDYQKHVTEYGVHWNFFITLALVKVLSHIVIKVSRGHGLACGLILLLIHQYVLKYSLEAYVLSNLPRNDLVSANREGLVSLCGYLSLYLVGTSIEKIVDPWSKQPITGNEKSRIGTLCQLVVLSTVLFGLLYWFNTKDLKVSRRLANLPYVAWVSAVGITLLAITLAVELLSVCFLPVPQRLKSKIYSLITPAILESINYNGLAFFLTSNLFTGLINVSIDVFNLEIFRSMIVLLSYMFVNCALMFFLYLSNIQFKLW